MVSPERAAARVAFEREALGELDALRVFAFRLTRVRADAEDLVSDTLTRALERWEQYRLGTNIRAWLCTILYRLFVSARRRVGANEVLIDDEANARALEAVGETDPETTFYDSFLDDEVVRALDDLPDEYRAAVTLSDLDDLQYAEIACVLGVPEGTVKSRLFRGRRLLQRKLARYAMEMGYVRRRHVIRALASGGSCAA
jgi:RNA polymerase sigma-70 factor (ECF subfamily)